MQTAKIRPALLPSASWLSPIELETIGKYIHRASDRYGNNLGQVILFGSRARGEGDEESDIDMAVIITAGDRHVRRELLDLATEIWLETGIKISPLILSSEEFETLSRMGMGIIATIQKEGIKLL